jgi:hypothetical protein
VRGLNWICLAQGSDKWWVIVMNLRVP